MNKQEHEALRLTREQRLEAILRELNDHLSFGDAPSEMLDRVDAILAEPAAFGFDYSIQTRTATGTAQAEPAPSQYSDVVSDGGMDPRSAPAQAQDERDAFEAEFPPPVGVTFHAQLKRYCAGFSGTLMERDVYQAAWEGWQARASRPAQTEQQPVAWLHSRSGAVATEATKRAMEDGSVPSGYDIPLYAAPIAQKVDYINTSEQQPCGYQYQAPDGVWFPIAKSMIAEAEEHGHKVRPVYAAPIAQTEQQPLIYINPMVIDELEGKRKASPGGLTWSRKALAHWTFPLYAAPIAQTEQQPVACRYRKADGADRAWTYSGSVTAPADGYEVQYLYAAPTRR